MKKLFQFLCASFLIFNLVGCSEEYEDKNGENNYTLNTITDENIINLDLGASGLNYQEETIGDVMSTDYSSDKFNGVEQIYLTNFITKSDVTVYIGHLNVKSGNFKLAIINNDQIIQEIPLDAFNKEFYFEDIKGAFSIHVAGENAAFEFHIDVYE